MLKVDEEGEGRRIYVCGGRVKRIACDGAEEKRREEVKTEGEIEHLEET